MFDDAFADTEREIESRKGDIALLEDSDNAQRVQVVIEAQAMRLHGFVECALTRVAERWMADIVHQRKRLGEITIQAQRGGDRAGKLGHFDGVGKAAPVVVRVAMRKYLRLPGKPAKGPRMNDAGAVALEGGAIGVRRLAMSTSGKRLLGTVADRACGGQRNRPGCCVWLAHTLLVVS